MGLDEATRAYEHAQYVDGTFEHEKGVEIYCPTIFQRGPRRTVPKTILQQCAITYPRRISSTVQLFFYQRSSHARMYVCVYARVTLATC